MEFDNHELDRSFIRYWYTRNPKQGVRKAKGWGRRKYRRGINTRYVDAVDVWEPEWGRYEPPCDDPMDLYFGCTESTRVFEFNLVYDVQRLVITAQKEFFADLRSTVARATLSRQPRTLYELSKQQSLAFNRDTLTTNLPKSICEEIIHDITMATNPEETNKDIVVGEKYVEFYDHETDYAFVVPIEKCKKIFLQYVSA